MGFCLYYIWIMSGTLSTSISCDSFVTNTQLHMNSLEFFIGILQLV